MSRSNFSEEFKLERGASNYGARLSGLPIAMGNGRPASLAAWRSAAQPGHLRGCCGLVGKDQPIGIEAWRGIEPDYAPAQDIGGLLL